MSGTQHRVKHLSAGRFIGRNFGKVVGHTLLQIALRLVALAPLGAALAGFKCPLFGEKTMLAAALMSAALYLFMVMPLRYLATRQVWKKMGAKGASYGTMLTAALRRVAVGLLWGLPFIASLGLWVYAFNGMDMPTFFSILTALGNLVGGRFDAGIILWVGGIAVFALLFAFGWWYNMPKDYANLSLGTGKAFKQVNRMRAGKGFAYVKNAVVNMLLTVPSLVLVAAIVGMHYVGSIKLSMGAMAAAQQLMTAITKPLPADTVMYLALALLLVHVPLCVIRKVRNAVLTAKLCVESEHKA